MNVQMNNLRRLGAEAALLLAFFHEAKQNVGKGAFRYSFSQLEKDCGMSRYVLKRIVQQLETEGLIKVTRLSQKSRMIIDLLD